MQCKNINLIPSILENFFNSKKQENNKDLFIRTDFLLSKEKILSDDYYLAEIIFLLTILSSKADIYMMKICEMSNEHKEFFVDLLSKYLEMKKIFEFNEFAISSSQEKMSNYIMPEYNHKSQFNLFLETSNPKERSCFNNKNEIYHSKKDINSKSLEKINLQINDFNGNKNRSSNNFLYLDNDIYTDNNDIDENIIDSNGIDDDDIVVFNDKTIKNNSSNEIKEKNKLDILMKKNTELIKENQNLTKKINFFDKELKKKQKFINSLKKQKNELISKNQEIKEKNDSEIENSNNIMIDYELLKKENEKQNIKLIEYETLISNYKNEIESLKNSLNKKENLYNSTNKKLEEKLKASQNKIISLEKKIKEQNTKLKKESQKLINSNNKCQQYKEYKEKYENLLKTVVNISDNPKIELTNEMSKIEEQLLISLKNNLNIQKENEKLRNEIQNWNNKMSRSRSFDESLNYNEKQIPQNQIINYINSLIDKNNNTENNKNINKYQHQSFTEELTPKNFFSDNNCIRFSQPNTISANNLGNLTDKNYSSLSSNIVCCTARKIKRVHDPHLDNIIGRSANLNSNLNNKNNLKNTKSDSQNSDSQRQKLLSSNIIQNYDNIFSASNLPSFKSSNKTNPKINKKTKRKLNEFSNKNNINEINKIYDQLYSLLKNNKQSYPEFLNFAKKIEMNYKKNNNCKINSRSNFDTNNAIIEYKDNEIKLLKNQLNNAKRKESEAKLKLTFMESEKIKMAEEKNKLKENLRKLEAKKSISEFDFYTNSFRKEKKSFGKSSNKLISTRFSQIDLNNYAKNCSKILKHSNSEYPEKNAKYSFKRKKGYFSKNDEYLKQNSHTVLEKQEEINEDKIKNVNKRNPNYSKKEENYFDDVNNNENNFSENINDRNYVENEENWEIDGNEDNYENNDSGDINQNQEE